MLVNWWIVPRRFSERVSCTCRRTEQGLVVSSPWFHLGARAAGCHLIPACFLVHAEFILQLSCVAFRAGRSVSAYIQQRFTALQIHQRRIDRSMTSYRLYYYSSALHLHLRYICTAHSIDVLHRGASSSKQQHIFLLLLRERPHRFVFMFLYTDHFEEKHILSR